MYMIIGVDIDDTLTDIRDQLKEAALNYAKSLGKEINNDDTYIEDRNNGNTYKVKYNFNDEELVRFFKEVQEEIVKNVKPRKGVEEAIKKLREEGHTIIIITARDSKLHDDPYELSKTWLDKNGIEYDKIIVNAQEKDIICQNEKVDLFIDDQLANCTKVSKTGIQVIRITNYEEVHGNIINKKNWMEIYDYIKEFETKK